MLANRRLTVADLKIISDEPQHRLALPLYPAKKHNPSIIVQATFFVNYNENDEPVGINMLYRIFGMRHEDELPLVQKEIQRQAANYLAYNSREDFLELLPDIRLERQDWAI